MGRSSKKLFPPWMTKNTDRQENRFIRLGNSRMLSEEVNQLSHLAYRILTNMYLESGGKIQFEFPRSKYKKFASSGGADKAIKELEAAGFIEVVEHNKNLRTANVYRFSEKWKKY